MSFFDQPYYALNKFHMSRQGLWPEQSKCVRIILPLAIFATILTLVGPGVAAHYLSLLRLHNAWGEENNLNSILQLLCAVVNFGTILNSVLNAEKMKVMLEMMKENWKFFKNTSAVVVLDKYAERGRYLTTIYTICGYIMLVLYLTVPILLPIMLNYVHPLNETRPKRYIHKADYGVDPDKYYWFMIAHSYIVVILTMHPLIAIDAMLIMWVEHTCALFAVVRFNLKLATAKYTTGKKNADIKRNDCQYRKICECIIVHKEAISFASMIESMYSAFFAFVIGVTTIGMSLTGVEAIKNMGRIDVLIQLASFSFGQIFHLYFSSVPGQKMIDHSLKIHTFAYDLDWYHMSVRTQKLLILILIRSSKPCLLTAGKVYVLSMESFGSVMQTALSYMMIFAQLL